MQLKMLKNFSNTKLLLLALLVKFSILISIIFVWNYIFSKEVNCFLFGTEKLQVLKGFGIYYIVDALIATNRYSPFKQNKEEE